MHSGGFRGGSGEGRRRRITARHTWRGIADPAADGPLSLEAGIDAAADGAERVQGQLGGDAIQLQRKPGIRVAAGQLAGQARAPIANRRVTEQVLDPPVEIVKDEAAGGVEVDGRGGRKLGAVHAGGTQPGGQAGRISGAVHVDLAGEVAAPALIVAPQQARELAQLGLAPIHIEVDRHMGLSGPALQATLQAHDSGIGEVEADICSSGLSFQPHGQSPGFSCQKERSAFSSEKGSFSTPFLMLTRESVASR